MLNLNRRSFLQIGSLAVAGGSIGNLWGAEPAEAPKFAKETTFEPIGLFATWQADPTTTMTLQWIGAEGDAAARPLWYRKADDMVWSSQKHTARRFPMTDRWIHRAELSGLTPGSDYVFRVGLDSVEQRFYTMPAKSTNTLQFVSGGDSGAGDHAVHTNKVAAAQDPMFVVMGGDIAYENGKAPGQFLQFFKNYSRDLRDSKQRLIPLLGCLGNHEVDGSYGKTRKEAPFFYSMFDGLFPEKGFASLDFGDYLSLVMLDTGHTTPIEGEQTDWLAKTLKEREDHPAVFVFNHVPAYPSYRSFVNEGLEVGTGAPNRKYWCPLFERYNVDAVFEHHDHTYKRTHPMLDGKRDPNGVLYLGDGSWGKIRKPASLVDRTYLAAVDEAFHLSVHRIEGDQRFHVALSDSGRVVDVCSTTKRPSKIRG